MPMGLGMGLGLSVSRSGGAAAPAELFPDPTLSQVTDSVNGWGYSNGYPSFGPKNNTGPGLQADNCFDDDIASPAPGGTLDVAFAANIAANTNYTVALTFANVSVSTTFRVSIGNGGASTTVAYTPANGTVSNVVRSGDSALGQLLISAATGFSGGTFDLTHVSVTAA